MKTFKKMAAQGDMMIVKIERLPDGCIPGAAENGQFVLAHSETGHNHVIEANPDRVAFFNDPSDPLCAYLQVIADDVYIEHKRSFDTHEALNVPPGNYKIRRQREYTPEGFRRAAD